MNKYDCIVIGAGPCGVTTAIYLKRFNLNVCVISIKDTKLKKHIIENYYGIESINGYDLFDKGINQLKSLNIDVYFEEVTSIDKSDILEVKTNKNTYFSKTVMISIGSENKKLNIKNIDKFDGCGVSYCAVCDGFFYRNKRIGILGSGALMESELEVLKNITNDITIFTNGAEYKNEKFNIIDDKIISLEGDTRLKSIITTNGKYDLDGLFIAYGVASLNDFSKHIGISVKDNHFLVDENYMTNVEGIFAGGDIIGGIKQISKASYDGMSASFSIKKYLEKNKHL